MNYRKTLIKLFTFLGGIYFFLEFILPQKIGEFEFGKYHTEVSYGFSAIASLAFGLGIINILAVHGGKIIFAKKGWVNSSALIIAFFAMILVTTFDWLASQEAAKRAERMFTFSEFATRIKNDFALDKNPAPIRNRVLSLVGSANSELKNLEFELNNLNSALISQPENAAANELRTTLPLIKLSLTELANPSLDWSSADSQTKLDSISEKFNDLAAKEASLRNAAYENSTIKKAYTFLYEGLFTSLGSSMFALLGFYIAAAAYRAFRIRSFESALMMLAALIVILGQIPFGGSLLEYFPGMRSWLLEVPSSAAFRAIKIGAGIASLILAFRMWFSIETDRVSSRDVSSRDVSSRDVLSRHLDSRSKS